MSFGGEPVVAVLNAERGRAASTRIDRGESLAQLARAGIGVARVGRFAVVDDLACGALVPLLEPFNPQDREPLHALFVGGSAMPARVRVFVDFLVERLADQA